MKERGMWQRAWVEIDLDALKENYHKLRSALPHGTKLCCVIKANAYGHGAVEIARLYEKLGADFLAVSNMEEALELRYASISLPILILGYTAPDAAKLLSRYDISQCVFSCEYAEKLSACAERAGVRVKTHIKLDSGMGRIGFVIRNEKEFTLEHSLLKALSLPSLYHEGIFTHFAMSDLGEDGEDFTKEQAMLFEKTVQALKELGYSFPLCHACNSAAISDYPEYAMNMVRAGIVLYGYQPSGELRHPLSLTPALRLRGIVDMVKTIAPGDSVSYGGRFVAKDYTRIATVPIGYADGLFRHIEEVGAGFSLRGCKVSPVGRICMDQCMLDVSALPYVESGDVVTFYGENGEDVAALAARLGTVPYELITALGERLPRVYIENGKCVLIKNRILPDGYPLEQDKEE